MPRRTVPLKAGEYYHLYNRGVNRQEIFFNRENHLFFLRRVRKYLTAPKGRLRKSEQVRSQPKVSSQPPNLTDQDRMETSEVLCVVAYCLMPNHYHLLVKPHHDNLSHRMQLFGISYTKAINKQEKRVGSLFQGQFQAVHVDSDTYLLHLSRYLHLNPVAAGLVKRAEDWEFSSYRDYIGLRQGTLPAPDIVLSQFQTRSDYQAFVEAYQSSDKELIAHLLFDDDY